MVRSLGDLGVRRTAFDGTVALFCDVRGPDGNVCEILGRTGADA